MLNERLVVLDHVLVVDLAHDLGLQMRACHDDWPTEV